MQRGVYRARENPRVERREIILAPHYNFDLQMTYRNRHAWRSNTSATALMDVLREVVELDGSSKVH